MGGGGVRLHHAMVALTLQQFQCILKKIFRRRLRCSAFSMLFGPCDGCKGGPRGPLFPYHNKVQHLLCLNGDLQQAFFVIRGEGGG